MGTCVEKWYFPWKKSLSNTPLISVNVSAYWTNEDCTGKLRGSTQVLQWCWWSHQYPYIEWQVHKKVKGLCSFFPFSFAILLTLLCVSTLHFCWDLRISCKLLLLHSYCMFLIRFGTYFILKYIWIKMDWVFNFPNHNHMRIVLWFTLGAFVSFVSIWNPIFTRICRWTLSINWSFV